MVGGTAGLSLALFSDTASQACVTSTARPRWKLRNRACDRITRPDAAKECVGLGPALDARCFVVTRSRGSLAPGGADVPARYRNNPMPLLKFTADAEQYIAFGSR